MGASIISVIATSSGAAAAYLRTGSASTDRVFLVMGTMRGAHRGAPDERGAGAMAGAHSRARLSYSVVARFGRSCSSCPREVPDDWVAMRFGLEGVYYDRHLGEEVKYRATHVGRGFAAMYGAGVLSGLLGIGAALSRSRQEPSCGCP